MSVSEQVQEIITSNGQRIRAMFREVSRRSKLYKRAQHVWTFDTVEERALEALLTEALTEHLERRLPQTIVAREFYAIVVTGSLRGGVEIRVMHPISPELTLSEWYEPTRRMIDWAFQDP